MKDSEDNPTKGDDGTGTYNVVYQMLFGKYSKDSDGCFRTFTGVGDAPRYWLASNAVETEAYNLYWGLFEVSDGVVYGNCLYRSDEQEENRNVGVRPVVFLKSDILLEWNEAAKEWKIK